MIQSWTYSSVVKYKRCIFSMGFNPRLGGGGRKSFLCLVQSFIQCFSCFAEKNSQSRNLVTVGWILIVSMLFYWSIRKHTLWDYSGFLSSSCLFIYISSSSSSSSPLFDNASLGVNSLASSCPGNLRLMSSFATEKLSSKSLYAGPEGHLGPWVGTCLFVV